MDRVTEVMMGRKKQTPPEPCMRLLVPGLAEQRPSVLQGDSVCHLLSRSPYTPPLFTISLFILSLLASCYLSLITIVDSIFSYNFVYNFSITNKL